MSRRARAAAAALALAAGGVACGQPGGGPTEPAVRASAGAAPEAPATTTATTPATAPAPAAGPVSTTSTTAGRSAPATAPTTTARPPAAASTAPRALTPAPPGTYRYDTSGAAVVNGTATPYPSVTTMVVDPPTGTRQRSNRLLRDSAGNGSALEYTLDFRPDGVYLVSLRISTGFAGATDVRSLIPATPLMLLPTGARPGVHLEGDLRIGESTARLVVDVVGQERLSIGGQAVDTLVVRAVVTLPPGDVTGRQELLLNVDPRTSLWVRERSVADAAALGGLVTLRSNYTATLQRLP